MLTDASLGVLFKRLIGFGTRLRQLGPDPTRRFLSLFTFQTVRTASVFLRRHPLLRSGQQWIFRKRLFDLERFLHSTKRRFLWLFRSTGFADSLPPSLACDFADFLRLSALLALFACCHCSPPFDHGTASSRSILIFKQAKGGLAIPSLVMLQTLLLQLAHSRGYTGIKWRRCKWGLTLPLYHCSLMVVMPFATLIFGSRIQTALGSANDSSVFGVVVARLQPQPKGQGWACRCDMTQSARPMSLPER
jgi:hypothetical protein